MIRLLFFACADPEQLGASSWPVDLHTITGGTHTYDPTSQSEAVLFWWAER